MVESKLKRQLEEKQQSHDICIQKLNFFRANMNQLLEKDKKVLDSMVLLKSRQLTFSDMISQLKGVRVDC